MSAGAVPSIRSVRQRLARPGFGRERVGELAQCGECGYELDGLLAPDSPGLCPECGGSFNPFAPHRPWTRGQWAWFLLGGCGPTLVLLAIAWASTLAAGEGLRVAIGIAGPFWVFMLAYATLVWPALWTSLRRDERSRPERRRMLVSCYLGAVLPVVLLIFGSLL